jgi:hypothetical protein
MPTTGQVQINHSLETESRLLVSAQKFDQLIGYSANRFDALFSVLSYLVGVVLGLLALIKLLR